MASHDELVAELPKLEKLSNAARLKHARKRRQRQLKKFQEQLRLDRQTVGYSLKKRTPQKINFEEGALLCDFVSRNDIIGGERRGRERQFVKLFSFVGAVAREQQLAG